MSQVEPSTEEQIRSPTSPLDPKNKISPRKKLVQKAKEEQQELQQSYEEEEIDDAVDDATDSSLPIQNNWRTAYVHEQLFPNGTPQDVHVYIKFNTRTNPDPLRCNTTRFVDLREMDGTVVNSIYSSLKYELHQEVTIRCYHAFDTDKKMSFPPCLSMKIQVMSADTHEELKKSDTYLKGKIDCTLIPTEVKKDENITEQTYTSTQKIQFAKGARDQKAFFQISYYDARDVQSTIPVLTLSSPNFSVWSRHTRNSSKKPGRPKKDQTHPPASSTFSPENKRVADFQASPKPLKKQKTEELYSQHIGFDQYTDQFYKMLNFLADKDSMGTEERKMAFKMAYQQLCLQQQ